MALTRKWFPSPNYSPGRSEDPRLIVIHTAEGARSIESLGRWFSNPDNDVSSHAGIDDTPKTVGIYVKRENRAWTQAGANGTAVSVELCGFANWTREEWLQHPDMLRNCADWIAEEAKFFDIPIVRLTHDEAVGSGRGVCQHSDLGAWGGGHWDCGNGFPLDLVLEMARKETVPAETEVTWYFIQDITAVRIAGGERQYYGGWGSKSARDNKIAGLKRKYKHPFRAFKDDGFDSPFFIDNSGYVMEIYGGWRSKEGRDQKLIDLERVLGRKLRPFSETRTAAEGGVPWGCVNLFTP